MRVIEVSRFGGPEVLQIVEKECPSSGIGQVVVKVEAVGVNPVETYIRAGTYPVLPELPYVPGGNAAGVIHSCGKDVSNLKVGQRVYIAGKAGAYSEYCLCEAREVYPLPDVISFEEGAAIGVPAATAYRALFIRGGGRAKERVLVHGASGSVGMAALQLGAAAGMEMHGTAGTEEGLRLIRSIGAVKTFLHRGDYLSDIKKNQPEGYDLILEMLANKNLESDLSLLGRGGRVVIIGSRGRIEIDPRATMGKEIDIRGLALANATEDELRETHEALGVALSSGVLKPVIADIIPLAEAHRAHVKVLAPGNCGKIVLVTRDKVS
jgi:NADPH2:quinone reductase